MKDYILNWCIAVLFTCCVGTLCAQTTMEKEVMALFDTPITWLRHYEGQIDEVHPAKMILAFDGFNCKGYMQYSDSETHYLLEGSLQSSQFVFLEKYQNVPSGYINGNLDGEKIVLDWTSVDDKQIFTAHFERLAVINVNHHEDLSVTDKGALNVHRISSYIDHNTIIKTDIPTLNEDFDNHINQLVSDWNIEIERQKLKPSKDRFSNKAETWFKITELSDKYFSGHIHFTSSWNDKVNSLSFSYDRENERFINTSAYFKSTEKWEDSVKDRMLKTKPFGDSDIVYENWIENVSLLDPVLCDIGIKISTEKSSVFGQVETLMRWENVSSDLISPAKLKKMKR